jgi:tetratricopeptide (TPR) repeat protein
VLLLVAAAEPTGDLHLVLRAAGQLDARAGFLDDAERARLVQVTGATLQFRHPLIRSAVYGGATYSRRRAAHLALAEVIGPGQPDRWAWHRAAVTDGPDAQLAGELESSADRAAQRGGHAAAAAALERAATLTPDPSVRTRRLVAAAGEAWQAGRFDWTSAMIEQAESVRPIPPDVSAETMYLRGCLELHTGHTGRAGAMMRQAAEALAVHAPGRALQMLADAVQATATTGDLSQMQGLWSVAQHLRTAGADSMVLDLVAGLAAFHRRDLPQGYALLGAYVRRAGHTDDVRHLIWAGGAAVFLGDEVEASRYYARAVSLARRTGALGLLPWALGLLAMAEAHSGQIAVAESDAREGSRLAEELAQTHWLSINLAALARIAAYRGRQEDCWMLTDQVIDSALRHGLAAPIGVAVCAQAELDLALGRPIEAGDRLTALIDGEYGVAHPVIVLASTPDRIEAAVRAGLEPLAGELARFEAFAAHARAAWAPPLVKRCQALHADGTEADRLFAEALALHEGTQRPFDLARTRLLYGEHLRRRKARRDAATQLRAALGTFITLVPRRGPREPRPNYVPAVRHPRLLSPTPSTGSPRRSCRSSGWSAKA